VLTLAVAEEPSEAMIRKDARTAITVTLGNAQLAA
jgi:hypothetical protein